MEVIDGEKLKEEIKFKEILDVYCSSIFNTKSFYTDSNGVIYNYNQVISFIEYYVKNNIISDDLLVKYHLKRRSLDTSVELYKNDFNKFLNFDFEKIDGAIVYVQRYSDLNELMLYRNILKIYYEKYNDYFKKFEQNRFVNSKKNPICLELPLYKILKEYVTYVLKEDFNEYKSKKLLLTTKPNQLLHEILINDNYMDLVSKFEEENIYNYLSSNYIYDFIIGYSKFKNLSDIEFEKAEENLRKRVRQIKDVILKNKKDVKLKQKNRNDFNDLEIASRVINSYINNGYKSVKDFCVKNNIDPNLFRKYLDLVKKYNFELYKEFYNYFSKQRKQRFDNIIVRIKKLVDMIRNGIQTNDNIRKFDIVDYYLYTSMSFEEIVRISKDILSKEDLTTLKIFFNRYKASKKISLDSIYNERNIVEVNNTKYEVTQIDKKNVVSYLKENRIPLLSCTYSCALKRYLNSFLVKNENNKKRI